MSKFALLLALAGASWFSAPANAVLPPSLPLPACVDGQGACPATNPLVTGTASGTLTAGGSVLITTMPTNGVCGSMNGYTYIWSPSGCFAGVVKPVIVTCAYIDLKDMRFKEMQCQSALYKKPAEAPAPLFTLLRPAGNTDYNGSTQCGAAGNYQTYAWGGPATITEAIWQSRGDRARFCELSMGAKRPDGLYGPTWAKVRVGIIYGEDGIGRSGRSESAEFYLPIDGDLRGGVDASVLVTHELSGSDDERMITLSAIVENKGEVASDSVTFTTLIPDQLHVQSVSDSNCTLPDAFAGGELSCTFALPGNDDPLGRNMRSFDIEARIINASDFQEGRMEFKVQAANDADPTNNEDAINVRYSLRSSGWSETMQLMEPLLAHFNYRTPDSLLDKQCDAYMNDIYARLNAIRDDFPHLFSNLSFGRITSGGYSVAPGVTAATAGHVGVVVFPKGTDYHQTGIVIHGTPTWSPTDLDIETQRGTMAMGDHMTINFIGDEGTADHGLYYRTRIRNFPGHAKPENPLGCGFEGAYVDNAGEFMGAPVPAACQATTRQPDPAAMTCPFYPDALLVRTESPVDLVITNSKGQRVRTSGGVIAEQGLDSGIFSYPVAHDDGTFGWTLVLPKDDYDVALTGTGTGPYKLTMREYDTAGKRVDRVIEGDTVPGRVDAFVLDGATAPVVPGGDGDGDGDEGGGGAMDTPLLLGLGLLLLMLVMSRRRA